MRPRALGWAYTLVTPLWAAIVAVLYTTGVIA